MIELPRAALFADEIAEYAEFFSFGTNDLTQTTLGVSPRRLGVVPHFYSEKEHPQATRSRRSTPMASAS